MPLLLDETMEELKTASNYQFSAVKVDELGASEYTLVTIAQDISGSVYTFGTEMEDCLKVILDSCQSSQRSENLMLRLIGFNYNIEELHGFKMLNTIQKSDYDGILNPNGGTALYDAVQSSIEATKDYAQILYDQEYTSNAIIFVITDGDDNSSAASAASVKKAVNDAMQAECLESITIVLVGVNSDNVVIGPALEGFKTNADITQFVGIGEATPNKLAKLANFISRSISSTSQSLGSGTASELLTF